MLEPCLLQPCFHVAGDVLPLVRLTLLVLLRNHGVVPKAGLGGVKGSVIVIIIIIIIIIIIVVVVVVVVMLIIIVIVAIVITILIIVAIVIIQILATKGQFRKCCLTVGAQIMTPDCKTMQLQLPHTTGFVRYGHCLPTPTSTVGRSN